MDLSKLFLYSALCFLFPQMLMSQAADRCRDAYLMPLDFSYGVSANQFMSAMQSWFDLDKSAFSQSISGSDSGVFVGIQTELGDIGFEFEDESARNNILQMRNKYRGGQANKISKNDLEYFLSRSLDRDVRLAMISAWKSCMDTTDGLFFDLLKSDPEEGIFAIKVWFNPRTSDEPKPIIKKSISLWS